ncbi:MAG: DUF4097 family beta strand repeat protein [Clostridia bacterium]|nr:DUF4097 family beta strand repeat protein [Clostridia bacterium]
MKKSTLILLIIAASLVVGGILLCVVGLALSSLGVSGKISFISLEGNNMVTNEYEISEAFSDLDVLVSTTNVELLPATDGVTKVVCREDPREVHEVFVENGTLKLRMEEKPWYQKISLFSVGKRSVTIYLAETELGALSLSTNTGDVRVAKELSFECATVTTDTGAVAFASTVQGMLSVKVDTGEVSLLGTHADEIEVKSSTGDQTYESVVCRTLSATSSTGEQEYRSVDCRTLTASSSTGEQEYVSVTVAETMTLRASTGDISIEGCDAAEVSVVTDTGDVEGYFLSEMVFYTETDTGKVRVPKSTSGGLCEIKTDTGDIEFSAP